MGDGGTTLGVWIGDGDDLLDRVDRRLSYGDSRSEYVRDALEFRIAIDDALEETDIEFGSERDKRAFVRQAVFDAARSQADG